jgi:Phytanoyl-CoA dioxygenase (PhyH)
VGPLSDAERYAFDLQGFLVRRGVLTGTEVAALNTAVDALNVPPPADTIQSQRFSGHLPAAAGFRALIDHPAVFEVMVELCGRYVRLDHAYGIIMAPQTSGLGLHGGAAPFDPAQYYVVRNGNIHCGLVSAQWALVDHPAEAGGFCCVPGSHKASYSLPNGYDRQLVREVPMDAGDVVIFTEALTHGTRPWQGPGQRRTLLYKYSPGSSTWAEDQRWPDELLRQLTDRQKLLLQPPAVAYHQPVTGER